MPDQIPTIMDHEEVVSECKGCGNTMKNLNIKIICTCHRCPRIQWWFGEICPQATHDPVKEVSI
jgi:hypothetical protein